MTQPADKSSFTQHLDRIARSVSFICAALISVASRAAEIFERSKTEQRRELIAFAFSNLRLRGKKLEFSLRSPFDLMVNRASCQTGWGTRIRT